jgi:hypothetical protein
VSDTDELIGSALRDLAAQAVTVPPTANAIWRAGQRRRRRNVIAVSATAPGAAAVAAVLAFTLGGGGAAAPAGHGGGATGVTGPVALSTPIQFEQVARARRPSCPATVNPWTGRVNDRPECIRFSGTGMTVTRLESTRIERGPGGYQIDIRLAPADARRFATLTRMLAGQHSPRNRLAIVTNGHVLADPTVLAAMTTGQAAIPGFATQPQARYFLDTLIGG